MDLLQNPFYILTATTQDNRQKIMELAEERSLLLDPNECTQARSDLTHPRKRLAAEIAWLPGIGPKRTSEVLKYVESSAGKLSGTDRLPQFKSTLGVGRMIPIAQANLLAAGLSRLADYSSDFVMGRIISEWIVEIAYVFENIDPEAIRAIIDEERIVSGFPPVTDLSVVEIEIKERRNHYRQVMTSTLNNLTSEACAKVVNRVVAAATRENSRLILIDDIVDWYEIDIQESLEKEEANINLLAERIQTTVEAENSDSALTPMVSQLIQGVKNWDTFAQPIQISKKTQGLSHDASHGVAGRVRKLAVTLFNEYDKLDFSQQLTNMLQEVFAEVDEIAERIAEDARYLDEIANLRKKRVKIEKLIEKLQKTVEAKSADSILAPMVKQIIQAIDSWDAIAQSAEGHLIAISVRNLAVDIVNKHNKLNFARQLTYALQRAFGGVDELAERLAEDARTLNEIAGAQQRAIQETKGSWGDGCLVPFLIKWGIIGAIGLIAMIIGAIMEHC